MKKSFIPWLQKHFSLVFLSLFSIFINIIFGYLIFFNHIGFPSSAIRSDTGDTKTVMIELLQNAPVSISASPKVTSASSSESPPEMRLGEPTSLGSDKMPDESFQNQQAERPISTAGLNQTSTSVIPTSNSPNSDQSNKPIESSLLEPPSERTGAGALTRSMRRGSRSGNLPSNTVTYEQKSSSAKKFFDNLRMHGSAVDQEIICRLVNSQVICADGWVLSAPLADEWIKWSTTGLAPTEWPVNKTKLELLRSNP
jgi:hypothetical protein